MLCALFWESQAKKKKFNADNIIGITFVIFLSGLIAARIGFFIIYPSLFTGFADLLSIWQGGLVSYFGLFGGIATSYILIKKYYPQNIAEQFDLLANACLLGWGVGRIGNLLQGDILSINNAPLPLYESFWCFLLLLISVVMWPKKSKPGSKTIALFALYAFGRFFIDFGRIDSKYLGLGVSQLSSLILALIAFVILYFYQRKKDA